MPDDTYLTFQQQEMGAATDGFVVDTFSKAEWCAATVKSAEARKAKRVQDYAQQLDQLNRWKQQGDAADDATIAKMTALLEPYYAQQDAAGLLNRGRLVLPSGTVRYARQECKWSRDDAAIVAFLQAQGASYYLRSKTETSVAWNELKKDIVPVSDAPLSEAVLTKTGEIVPGLRMSSLAKDVLVITPVNTKEIPS